MSLQLHRPNAQGGLEPHPPEGDDWRRRLREPRWGASLPGRRLPPLTNPEVNPTPTWVAVAFWLALAVLTFVLLVAGYGSGFWH
jgi:hypothetical protein